VNGGTSAYASGGGPANLTSSALPGLATTFAGQALNLFLFNSGLGTAAYIKALQTQGALRELAEPNLVAMDGKDASFLAGGEFPVPIVQGGGDKSTVSIIFKEYGVRLNFKPTIVDEDHIRLDLEPEVSTIDFANGVKFDGFLIPALRTRRAKTSVELRDGQSFALAGLLDNNETKSLSQVPVLGDIPILGALFKSKSFQKNETELMFFVTAQLVKPVSPDDLPQLRGVDGLKNGSPLGVEPKGEGVQGQSGYKISGQNSTATPAGSEMPKVAEPKAASPTTNTTGTSGNEQGSSTRSVTLPPVLTAARLNEMHKPE